MTIAFTVCSANYLPFAKALGDSIIEHNKECSFIIALADACNHYEPDFFLPHRIIPVGEMQLPDLNELNSRYTIFELSCALKPYVGLFLLEENKNCDALFYFDSDILVYGSLTEAESVLKKHSLVITPHLSEPMSQPVVLFTELNVLKTGVYNTGFFGVNNSAQAINFLTWWKERLKEYCYNDSRRGLFVDQLWLNLALIYFRNSHVLFHPGYNLAYWNFSERRLSKKEESYVVNEEYPLIFFHYSGYDVHQPQQISRHQNYYSFETVPEYLPLFEKYARDVLNNNQPDFFSLPATMGIVPPPPPEPPPPPPPREKNFFKRKWKKLFTKRNR